MSAIKKSRKNKRESDFLCTRNYFFISYEYRLVRLNNRTYEYRQKNNVSTAEEQVFVASFTYAQIELCALFKRKGNNA